MSLSGHVGASQRMLVYADDDNDLYFVMENSMTYTRQQSEHDTTSALYA